MKMPPLLSLSYRRQIPLRFNNPELKAVLFPDLFPNAHGDACNRLSSNAKTITYGKSQLMGYDPPKILVIN